MNQLTLNGIKDEVFGENPMPQRGKVNMECVYLVGFRTWQEDGRNVAATTAQTRYF